MVNEVVEHTHNYYMLHHQKSKVGKFFCSINIVSLAYNYIIIEKLGGKEFLDTIMRILSCYTEIPI